MCFGNFVLASKPLLKQTQKCFSLIYMVPVFQHGTKVPEIDVFDPDTSVFRDSYKSGEIINYFGALYWHVYVFTQRFHEY